jgi:hypothetical protein
MQSPARDQADQPSCTAVLREAAGTEPSFVLAAYAGQSSGAVRVLRRNAAGALDVAFDAPAEWALPGAPRCAIRLHDVDGDGEQEAFVYFQGVRGSVAWIFKWDGAALTSLTPTATAGGRASSLLLSPVLYDLEHRGTPRLVAARSIEMLPPGQRARDAALVYRLGAGGYEVEKSILAIMGFRADVDPSGNLRSFRLVQDSTPPFRLRVINGDRAGNNRVAGATIFVNDQAVIGPQEVNTRTEFTTIVLPPLAVTNHVKATLTGPPDASIIVLVEDSTNRL